jgi:hypothetical protein
LGLRGFKPRMIYDHDGIFQSYLDIQPGVAQVMSLIGPIIDIYRGGTASSGLAPRERRPSMDRWSMPLVESRLFLKKTRLNRQHEARVTREGRCIVRALCDSKNARCAMWLSDPGEAELCRAAIIVSLIRLRKVALPASKKRDHPDRYIANRLHLIKFDDGRRR